MRVITALTQQLRGTLDAGRRADGSGACMTIRFPASVITEPGNIQAAVAAGPTLAAL